MRRKFSAFVVLAISCSATAAVGMSYSQSDHAGEWGVIYSNQNGDSMSVLAGFADDGPGFMRLEKGSDLVCEYAVTAAENTWSTISISANESSAACPETVGGSLKRSIPEELELSFDEPLPFWQDTASFNLLANSTPTAKWYSASEKSAADILGLTTDMSVEEVVAKLEAEGYTLNNTVDNGATFESGLAVTQLDLHFMKSSDEVNDAMVVSTGVFFNDGPRSNNVTAIGRSIYFMTDERPSDAVLKDTVREKYGHLLANGPEIEQRTCFGSDGARMECMDYSEALFWMKGQFNTPRQLSNGATDRLEILIGASGPRYHGNPVRGGVEFGRAQSGLHVILQDVADMRDEAWLVRQEHIRLQHQGILEKPAAKAPTL